MKVQTRTERKEDLRKTYNIGFYVTCICLMVFIICMVSATKIQYQTGKIGKSKVTMNVEKIFHGEVANKEKEVKFLSIAQEEAMLKSKCAYYPNSYDEVIYGCKVVISEAMNQGEQGQMLVAETIINRINSNEFSNDVIAVCNEPRQFSGVENGVPMLGGKPVEEVPDEIIEIFWEACKGSNISEELLKQEALKQGFTDEKYWKGGALFFSNLEEVVSQEELEKRKAISVKVKVGGHTFWRSCD